MLDFLIRWLKTAKTVDDNFRFWIICEGIDALTLTTVQKCCSHYLGHETTEVYTFDQEENQVFPAVPISAFGEAKDR